DMAGFAEPLAEADEVSCVGFGRAPAEQPDDLSRRLLCLRGNRPRSRAAKQRDELAALDHSITSSARASSVGGMSRPSALAVLRLITSSSAVGWMTGKSAGLTPLRICPVYTPTCRYMSGISGP